MPTRMLKSAGLRQIAMLLIALASQLDAAPAALGQLVVAHRGASADAPENTPAAFQLAWQQGADAIEADFWLTSDKQLACIHDGNTKRVARVDLNVAGATLPQLQQLDVGSWKDKRFSQERISTLKQVLNTIAKGQRIYIEIKSGPEAMPLVKADLRASGLSREQAVVIAFDKNVIRASKQLMPDVKAYWIVGFNKKLKPRQWDAEGERLLETAKEIGADGLDLGMSTKYERTAFGVVDPQFLSKCRQQGLELHAWTVDDPKLAERLSEMGFSSITTNRPQLIKTAREHWKAAEASPERNQPAEKTGEPVPAGTPG